MPTCENCLTSVPLWDAVSLGSGGEADELPLVSRTLCTGCANRALKEHTGWAFDEAAFDPIAFVDANQRPHTFHFRSRLTGGGHHMEAFEIIDGEPGGHRFEVLDDFEVASQELFGRLVAKVGRGITKCQLEDGELRPRLPLGRQVAGRIEWDPEAEDTWGERLPSIVIDGRSFTWQEFGTMWAAFEGFEFRLEMTHGTDGG